MPSPILPADICGTVPDSTGTVCVKVDALFSLAEKMCTFWTWAFDTSGNATAEFKALFASVGVPVGCVIWKPVNSIPDGYLLCNGQEVSRTTYSALFSAIGTQFGTPSSASVFKVPDLQGDFLRGSSTSEVPGATGGSETHTLTVAEIPENLTVTCEKPSTGATLSSNTVQQSSLDGDVPTNGDFTGSASGGYGSIVDVVVGGNGAAHNNLPPYTAGLMLIKY